MDSTFNEAQLSAAVGDRYRIEREIGHGGMATVYLARDPRHNRNVALKVLDAELGAVIGVERFLTEIKVTANLQHPNILPLYDSGSGNGLLYYVMPFVDGESLRDRLNRERQLPVDDALRITTAVAAALTYAHRHGVVHRDLKPENILLQDGQPLVADFGIALAVTNAGGNRITQTGLSLGTPQYMSPEQATGERAIDGRTDVYSLGCVLYEMLTGDPPHLGGSTQAVIAKLLTEKPASVRTVRDTVPAHVDHAIERALAKVPADRWSTPQEFADVLTGRAVTYDASNAPTEFKRRRVSPWVAAAAIGGILAGAGITFVARRAPPEHIATFYATLPGASLSNGFALSRDGAMLAYVGADGGPRQLQVRPLDQLEGHALSGTEGADRPVWSPDGRRIAFAANGKVLRISRDGGATEVVSPSEVFGFDWLDDESMVIGSSVAGSGLRIATHAGVPLRDITKPDTRRGEMFHANPFTLTRDRIAFVSWGPGGLEDDYIAIADAKTGKYVVSTHPAVSIVGLADDWLIYQSDDRRLLAIRCDLDAMQLRGDPVTLLEDIRGASISRGAALFVSGVRTTTLARIVPGKPGESRVLVQDAGTLSSPHVAPDGQHVVFAVIRRDGADLALYDVRAGTSAILRSAPFLNDPTWTPDGHEIIYYETGADSGLWRLNVDRPGTRSRLTTGNFPRQPSVAPDGKILVYMGNLLTTAGARDYSIQQLSLDASAPRASTSERELGSQPSISPDGRWLANGSLETGGNEIFVRGFGTNAAAPRVRISTNGGYEPRWSHDGHKLFYRIGQTVMAATLRDSLGTIRVVSRDSIASFTIASASDYDLMYDVGANGDLYVAAANDKAWQLVFSQNWLDRLKQRLAASSR